MSNSNRKLFFSKFLKPLSLLDIGNISLNSIFASSPPPTDSAAAAAPHQNSQSITQPPTRALTSLSASAPPPDPDCSNSNSLVSSFVSLNPIELIAARVKNRGSHNKESAQCHRNGRSTAPPPSRSSGHLVAGRVKRPIRMAIVKGRGCGCLAIHLDFLARTVMPALIAQPDSFPFTKPINSVLFEVGVYVIFALLVLYLCSFLFYYLAMML